MKHRKHLPHKKDVHKKHHTPSSLLTGRLIVPMFLTIAIFIGSYLVVSGTDFFSFANFSSWTTLPLIRLRFGPSISVPYPTGETSVRCIRCGSGCLPEKMKNKIRCPEVYDDTFKCVSITSDDEAQYCQKVPIDNSPDAIDGVNNE